MDLEVYGLAMKAVGEYFLGVGYHEYKGDEQQDEDAHSVKATLTVSRPYFGRHSTSTATDDLRWVSLTYAPQVF